MSELAGLVIGLILTLLIYSYIWGDNPLYRLAVHILVGVSAAYAAVIIVQQIFLPIYRELLTPGGSDSFIWLIPIVLGLLLLLKRLPRLSWMGRGTMALMIGVGAAVSLLGALTGTLWPQMTAVHSDSPILNLIIAFLTIATLITFQFTGRTSGEGEWIRPWWQQMGLVHIGQAVIMITFGALFAAVLNTSLILLIERISFFLTKLIQMAS
ncbi:MAG: hypothetical protein IAE79_18715 [Anaerolinea sp.]|nr:hypothetical protein [Anaerolinea sp.]